MSHISAMVKTILDMVVKRVPYIELPETDNPMRNNFSLQSYVRLFT